MILETYRPRFGQVNVAPACGSPARSNINPPEPVVLACCCGR